MLLSSAYAVSIFLLFLLLHCLVWNFSKKKNLGIYLILVIQLSTLSIMIIINHIFFTFDLDKYLTISLYFALAIVYLHFYVGITRSVSIRMLGELFQAQDHQMTYDELENVYSMEFMLNHRLATLLDHGWLENDGMCYKCTKKGLLMAKLQLVMKKLYILGQTG